MKRYRPSLTPYYDKDGITIYCADAKTAEHVSFDAILSDPMYDELDQYRWLRCLPCKGIGAVFTNAKWLRDAAAAIAPTYPILTYYNPQGAGMCGKIITKSHHLLMWGNSKLREHIPDCWYSKPWSKPGSHKHKWTKNPAFYRLVIKAITDEGDIILDPFCGTGPTLVAAKVLGRRAVGIEANEEHCKVAIERLRQGMLEFAQF